MNRLVLSSGSNVVSMLSRYPELYQIQGFSTLKPQVEQLNALPKRGCAKCGANKVSKNLHAIHPQIQAVLKTMTPAQWGQMKSILKLDELCYYVSEGNKLVQKCL